MKSHISYRVPYADTDQMGVVYYANYLVYFERVRNEILRDAGVPYIDMEKSGIGLPVIEAHVDYKKPSFYDDSLIISGWLESFSGMRVKVACEVLRNNETLASGYTIHIFLDLVTRLPKRPPPEIVRAFKSI